MYTSLLSVSNTVNRVCAEWLVCWIRRTWFFFHLMKNPFEFLCWHRQRGFRKTESWRHIRASGYPVYDATLSIQGGGQKVEVVRTDWKKCFSYSKVLKKKELLSVLYWKSCRFASNLWMNSKCAICSSLPFPSLPPDITSDSKKKWRRSLGW